MATLPRSIRWRLQLGLLELDCEVENLTISSLEQTNRDQVKARRCEYKKLKSHYALEKNLASRLSGKGDEDPLSLFAMEQEVKIRRMQHAKLERTETEETQSYVSSEEDCCYYEDETIASSVTYISSEEDVEDLLATIEKDIKRLQPQHGDFYRDYQQRHDDEVCTRTDELTDMLYIFAREHCSIGYYQGMHELASLLLLVVEMDTLSDTFTEDSMLLNPKYRYDDAYSIMRTLFMEIQSVFSGDTLNVTSKFTFVSADPLFLSLIKKMEVAPEIVSARWVRLLFSREVADYKTTLLLWDVFFDITTCLPNVISFGDVYRYSRPNTTRTLTPGRFEWITVLETTAASLIWMQRSELSGLDSEEIFLHLLNLTPLANVYGLMSTFLSTMRRIEYNISPLQSLPPSIQTLPMQKLKPAQTHSSIVSHQYGQWTSSFQRSLTSLKEFVAVSKAA